MTGRMVATSTVVDNAAETLTQEQLAAVTATTADLIERVTAELVARGDDPDVVAAKAEADQAVLRASLAYQAALGLAFRALRRRISSRRRGP